MSNLSSVIQAHFKKKWCI